MRETAEVKATRLLASGAVAVAHAVSEPVDAIVQGDHGIGEWCSLTSPCGAAGGGVLHGS